MPALPPQL